jgi:hypothetical protein
MENTCGNNEVKNDLFVRVKATKSPKDKTDLGLLEKTTMIAVEVSEAQTENANVLDLNIHIQSRANAAQTRADAGRIA